MTYRRMARIGIAGVILLALASVAVGQWGGRGFGRSRYPPRFKPVGHLDRGFTFCRLMFTSDHRDPSGRGWSTDYPFADINFMIRFSEMTSTQVDLDDEGDPNHWVVPISDDALFSCPFVMTSDVGTMSLTTAEAEQLRTYFSRVGFSGLMTFGEPEPGSSGHAKSGESYHPPSTRFSTSRSTTSSFEGYIRVSQIA